MKVIIIGGGQVGSYIAGLLLNNNCSVKVIENRTNVLNKLKKELPSDTVVFGSGTNPTVLEACGIADADVVVAVTGADETNLVASTIAKFEFSAPRVIARINNPKNTWMFDASMGVDVALNQADLMAHLVVEEMTFKTMLTLMKINRSNYSIIQVKVDARSAVVNMTVKELDIPKKATFIAIYRGNEVIIPHGDAQILQGDEILAFADLGAQEKINTLFGPLK